MTIEQHKDVESGHENGHQDLQEPFLQNEKDAAVEFQDIESNKRAENGSIGMVLLSTFVAVCGSFSFGTCVGYSSPTQAAIRADLNLSLSEVSILTSSTR
ncbi:sugar transporter ERD6-like 16-like [Trifolium medium]|uniref:Sugar transporter ERD6-like 16-like n=1 Tax=Trifolium medium TaxID=97028 RepID=A0A392NNB5_9FABA|nr:sugar transporter ERD6-like 16-like [Trifolium medium]